jgi:hypothetical protein
VGAAEALGGSGEDCLASTLRIFLNVAVPDAQHGPAFRSQPFVACSIARGLGMLTAVDLNHKFRLSAGKIDDVWPDRELPSEFWPETRKEPPYLPLVLRGV